MQIKTRGFDSTNWHNSMCTRFQREQKRKEESVKKDKKKERKGERKRKTMLGETLVLPVFYFESKPQV